MNAETFIDALRAIEEEQDYSAMMALYDDDSDSRHASDDKPHRGRDGGERFWHAYRAAFEEVRSDFHNVVEQDGTICLEWTSYGRTIHGAAFEYDGVSVVEFADGKIRRFRAYFDPSALAQSVRSSTRAQPPLGSGETSPSGSATSPSGA